jgi:hypothetical protein
MKASAFAHASTTKVGSEPELLVVREAKVLSGRRAA